MLRSLAATASANIATHGFRIGATVQRQVVRPCTGGFLRSLSTVRLAYDLHVPKIKQGSSELDAQAEGRPIVFLHGLFGSKINNRSVSKALARDLKRPVYCLDLRNHGDSPHAPVHDYQSMTADVHQFIQDHNLGKITIIGHSMGAKVAMALALTHSELVESCIPVDNAPIDTRLSSDFGTYIRAMQEIENKKVHTQKEAYEIMSQYEKSVPVQQFLLSNMKKAHGSREYHFRIPLDILAKNLGNMGDFPYASGEELVRFTGPALFIRGKYSKYVPDEAIPIIGTYFPRFLLKDVDAGHWLISEKPQEFVRLVVEFLSNDE